MNYLQPVPKKIRTKTLLKKKLNGEKITMLTCYDAITAAIFEQSGVDVLLVGDSVGTTILGYETTVNTSHQDMLTFTAAVARGSKSAFVLADLAFGAYQSSVSKAVDSGIELLKAGAHGVKLEGGKWVEPQVRALVEAGVAVCAHLGYTPQSINQVGGHLVQGREQSAGEEMIEAALALEAAGAFALVLELVPAKLAEEITKKLTIPTIGIGAGVNTDGQVLVWQDMAGLGDFKPKFLHRFGNLKEELAKATEDYVSAVKNGSYPAPEHSFE